MFTSHRHRKRGVMQSAHHHELSTSVQRIGPQMIALRSLNQKIQEHGLIRR